jgi:putative intracellular protease/amidase
LIDGRKEMVVHVFLNDDYSDWELGYVLPELRSPAPSSSLEKKNQSVSTFSLDGRPVRSMGGLRVTPDHGLSEVDPTTIDALILPGGLFWQSLESRPLSDLVLGLLERRVFVAAICAATAFLARLGVLNEMEHTSNGPSFLKERAPRYVGQAHYRDALAVRDGSLITASGLGAVDFTREILDALEVYPPRVTEVWYRAFKYGEDPYAGRAPA